MAEAEMKDPNSIEREVEKTQDDIGETIGAIEDRLDPQKMAESLLGENGRDNVKVAIDVARRNPIPVAMIVVGVAWLFATSDSPPIRRIRERITGKAGGRMDLRPRSEEPAPIGPPPETGGTYDRRKKSSRI